MLTLRNHQPPAGRSDTIRLSRRGDLRASVACDRHEIREHRLCLRRHVPMNCLYAVEAVEPHRGHEISVVFSLTPVRDGAEDAEPGPAPGRVKGRCAGRQGPRSAA